jgi:hypothetical protein
MAASRGDAEKSALAPAIGIYIGPLKRSGSERKAKSILSS